MRAWLIHVGEFLPIDKDFRPMRYAMLADALAAQGHTVTRWSPTFLHARKIQRYRENTSIQWSKDMTFELLYAPSYKTNTSIKRLLSSQFLAKEFRKRAPEVPRPDVIVAAIPAPEIAFEAVCFGKKNNIPVIIDVRDIWPDIYLATLPRLLKNAGKIAIIPFILLNRQIFKKATSVVAVSPSYLEWGLRYADRKAEKCDRVFPIGYMPYKLSKEERKEETDNLRVMGFRDEVPTACFIGSFEATYDLETVIETVHSMSKKGRPIQVIICGTGRKEEKLKELAAGNKQIIFTGWASAPTLATVMEHSHIGLCAYSRNAPQSLPNKPFEYASSGLPIVRSLKGDLEEINGKYEIGIQYQSGNVASLESAITKVFEDSNLRKRMSLNIRTLFDQEYNGNMVYKQFVSYLEELSSTSK